MGRTRAHTYEQPDDNTCGPASLKCVLDILGLPRKSLAFLTTLCKTGRNGTSVQNLIKAANKLGLAVLAVEFANLNHLQSALNSKPGQPRAVIVDYLYDLDDDYDPHEESGHYAAVASFSPRNSRIILFDSASGTKKSYNWHDFLNRWYDYDFKRRRINKRGRKYRLVKNWYTRLILILASEENFLPKFNTPNKKLFLPSKKKSSSGRRN